MISQTNLQNQDQINQVEEIKASENLHGQNECGQSEDIQIVQEPKRKLFLNYLPLNTSKEDLLEFFQSQNITSVEIDQVIAQSQYGASIAFIWIDKTEKQKALQLN